MEPQRCHNGEKIMILILNLHDHGLWGKKWTEISYKLIINNLMIHLSSSTFCCPSAVTWKHENLICKTLSVSPNHCVCMCVWVWAAHLYSSHSPPFYNRLIQVLSPECKMKSNRDLSHVVQLSFCGGIAVGFEAE